MIQSSQQKIAPGAYKNLLLFLVASSALLVSGFLFHKPYEWQHLILLLWLNFSGLFLIYRLNDFIDAQPDLRFNLRVFFEDKKHLWLTTQLFLVAIPIAFYVLHFYSLLILAAASCTGLLYSIQFRSGEATFRLKNVFLLKNVLIGTVWGSLILIGFGDKPDIHVIQLFLFTTAQVVIGSVIRDIPDIKNDRAEGVNSLPVILGKKITFRLMHVLNLSTLLLATIQGTHALTLICIIVSWRAINLFLVYKNPENPTWTQKINLMTCVLILCILVTQAVYSYYAN